MFSSAYENNYSMLMTRTTTSANVDRLYINNTSNAIDTLLTSGTPKFSISMWLKFSAGTDGQQISFMSKYEDFAGRDRCIILWRLTDNKIAWYGQYNSSSQCIFISTNNTYTSSSGWFHVCFVYDSSQTVGTSIAKIYVNGVEQGYTGTVSTTNKYFTNSGTKTNVTLGCRYGGGSAGTKIEGYGGNYDDVTFWDRALSSSEVTTLYNNGDPLNISTMTNYSSNCKAWYRMGDNPSDNWDGSKWNILSVNADANVTLISQNMVNADRVTDVY